MSSLRIMIGIFIKEQRLFRLPLAWGIFGPRQNDDDQITPLTERTTRVFQHLNVRLVVSVGASNTAAAMHNPPDRLTVVAVRYIPGLPEIYVNNRLLYPKIHSGSLTLAFDKLGLKQADHEQGDDEEDGDEPEGLKEVENAKRTL